MRAAGAVRPTSRLTQSPATRSGGRSRSGKPARVVGCSGRATAPEGRCGCWASRPTRPARPSVSTARHSSATSCCWQPSHGAGSSAAAVPSGSTATRVGSFSAGSWWRTSPLVLVRCRWADPACRCPAGTTASTRAAVPPPVWWPLPSPCMASRPSSSARSPSTRAPCWLDLLTMLLLPPRLLGRLPSVLVVLALLASAGTRVGWSRPLLRGPSCRNGPTSSRRLVCPLDRPSTWPSGRRRRGPHW